RRSAPSLPAAQREPERAQAVGDVARVERARLGQRRARAPRVTRPETRRREPPPAARLAADEDPAPEPVEGLGMLAHELLGEADGLLADALAVAGDAGRVAPVGEGGHVQEGGAEAQRDTQHEVQVVQDGEARVERPGRVERAAGETHALELPQVPAEDLGDADRARRERPRHARAQGVGPVVGGHDDRDPGAHAAPTASSKAANTPAAKPSSEKRISRRSRAAAPRRARRTGSRRSATSAAASARASPGGTRHPLTPSSSISGMPPTPLATIGRASAIPSRSASGKGSRSAGWTSTSSRSTTGNGFGRKPV